MASAGGRLVALPQVPRGRPSDPLAIFAPCTTIAYTIAQNSFNGLHGWGRVILAVGIVLDILPYASGNRSRRERSAT